jgi:hypothetical protein
MLFGETVAVYCENHTGAKCSVRISQDTHYVSTTETNRLILFGGTVAVYCGNHTAHTDTRVGRMQSFCMLKHVEHIVTTGP